MSGEWEDPFAQDEEAAERERRRAEREARRRSRQESLAGKVQSSEAEAVAAPAQPQAPPPPPVAPPAPDPPPLAPRPPGGDGPSHLRIRQAVGALVFLAVLGLLVFGVSKAIDKLGASDDPAPPPPKAPQTSEITIPEGLDRQQIADLAKKDGLKGDYLKATKKPPKKSGFELAKYEAKSAPNLEGFLFPDTWNDLPKKATVHDLVDRQLADFEQRFKGVDMSYAKSKNLTPYDVVNIASIIQREIAVPEEQKLAAAVIYNRLAANNPLGMDSTIRYYLHNYDQQLTQSELAQDEPYNTRIHTGLPPTPISNPGLAALKAAADPAKSDVFYFVIKPGTCNEHTFVVTDAEFQRAEAAYQQALQEQGGSPTEC
ncbi:MAG: hypothetical protein QOI10_3439 [Solirubrobacterales bacterium]|jgi:UPF0755 protein|nr:hypothetical protein [Solirubrobacterales bacterium]